MASRRNDSVVKGSKFSSDMFCLNFLPSVGEKRLVTLNVEASDNHLVSIHVFYPIRGLEIVWWKQTVFRSLVRIPCQASDLTLYHGSIDGPDMTSWKPIANLCLNVTFRLVWHLLKNPLKWLAEEMIQLLKATNLIRHVLLELSTLCRWKKTCDIECWGLRQPLSEYSCFLTTSGLETVWWKLTCFSFNLNEFIVRPLTDTVSRSIDGPDRTSWKLIANLWPECLLLDLFDCCWKTIWNG